MKAAPVFFLAASSAAWMAAGPPARAGLFGHDADCAPGTGNVRAETAAERCNARRFEGLDCRGLRFYAESYRARLNQQLVTTRYRAVAESAPEAAPLPTVRALPAPAPSDSPIFARPAPSASEAPAPPPTPAPKP